jgi:ankyrin repeat protein
MTMNLRRAVGSCAAVMLLAATGLSAGESDVADAMMRGDTAAIGRLLTQKVDVNATQRDGATAVHWAVYREDLATLDLLVKAGASVTAANRYGTTPLSMAAISGNAAIIGRLLAAGANVNERLPNGETPLMMASRTGNLEAMKVLLDHAADVNAQETLRGTTALMWAAAQGHPAAVQLLITRGANVGATSKPDMLGRVVVYQKAEDPRPSRKVEQALPNTNPNPRNTEDLRGGGLTALVYAARRNDQESVRMLLAGGADVNQTTNYGWSPLLVATQNRYYQLGMFLLEHGADPNVANKGGWTPLYLAVDNRNIEGGDYPVRKPDMDHLDFIKALVSKGANVNARMKDTTWGRTVFTSQWVHEDGATAFWRAAQSSDLPVMRLLLEHGADPKIATTLNITPLQMAAGIGWVEGVTYEWSEEANVETVKLLLSLGNDPNIQAETGRTALHGAAHKGRTAVIQLLVDAGARLDTRDFGMTGNDAGGRLKDHTWQAVDYADGLIRIGTQSSVAHPEAGLLLRKMMTERGMRIPPMDRTLESVCVGMDLCDDVQPEDVNQAAK